ncbi:YdcF family protein [Mycobacterium sp. DL592]|uniref:YdcF family protein n=1 Tax=Mycobacterium sp. DL592 TaxID=2675524 RepID=UPI0014210925|nr:YdcF family protein [Mycobacterium sp. DL592]
MARLRRVLAVVAVALVIAPGIAGYFLFTRSHADPLVKADAIVVLGGENDGRLQYGLSLAKQGYASTVVLSNSYENDPQASAEFAQACASGTATITVVCFRPDPYTTRGEAMFTARLAKERNWTHVIVVSWNFHMVRARYIFDQCFGGTVTMAPVPRTYDYSLPRWVVTYTYQYFALGKALLVGC